jgi:hypothetical protein
MPVFSGPEIPNDGLVFYVDSNNTRKSWRGKPTVNLIGSNFFNGNGNFTINQNINHFMPDGSTGIARLLNAQFVSDANRTVSIGSYSLQAGQTYTLSFYVMNIDCSGFSGNLYSPTLLRSIGSIVYPSVSFDTWTRVSTTFTVPNEGPNPVVLSPQAFRDGGNGRFKLCWLQLEEGSFATPYIDGTRASTQSLIDLSGINTVTATNLTYASNGAFSFDGSTGYLSTPYTQSSPNSFTVESWINSTEHSSDTNIGKIIVMSYSNYNGWIFSLNGTTSLLQLRHHNFNNSTTSYNIASSTGLSLNTWYHLAATDNGTTVRLYVNGVQVASGSSATSTTNSPMTLHVGAWPGAGSAVFFKGQISSAKIYNRALSATEITQNFEAIRGKYGI